MKMRQKELLIKINVCLKEILNTVEIYYYLVLEWTHLKESSTVMFLVLSAVEELL